jgi:hypothetical protein
MKFYEAKLSYEANEIVRVQIPFQCDQVIEQSIPQMVEEGVNNIAGLVTGRGAAGMVKPGWSPPIGEAIGGVGAGSSMAVQPSYLMQSEAAEETILGKALRDFQDFLPDPTEGFLRTQALTRAASTPLANVSTIVPELPPVYMSNDWASGMADVRTFNIGAMPAFF